MAVFHEFIREEKHFGLMTAFDKVNARSTGGFCDSSNEHSDSIISEELIDQMSNYNLLENSPDPWSCSHD
jgi:hypothetical protein